MTTVPQNIPKIFFTSLLIAVVSVLAYLGTQQFAPQQLSGDIVGVVGIAGTNLDPLLSGQPCFANSEAMLRVAPEEGIFKWSVTPPANVLSVPGGTPAANLEDAPSEIRFTRPAADDPNAATTYTVDAVPAGMMPDAAQSFIVTVSAPCVNSIDFVNPSGTVLPTDGAIQLNSIRATLSGGQTVIYDASQISQLNNFEFKAIPSGEDPATANAVTGFQFVGNRVLVPSPHPAVDIYMAVRGSALAPVVFSQNNAVEHDALLGGYALASDEVDPAFVTVWRDADANGEPDTIVEEGVNYTFHNVPHNPDVAVDWIEYTPVAGSPDTLYIAYSYHDSSAVLWSSPLTVGAIACNLLNANIFEGRGQGFALAAEGVTPAKGSHSAAFDFGGATPITSILISNTLEAPNTPFGAAVFELQFHFVAGLPARAQLMNHSGTHYEVNVRDEGAGHEQDTASNFAYAVNTTLGQASPFVAYLNPTENNQVILYSLEVGTHTNDYDCSVNGVGVAGVCFSGGTAAVLADSTAAGIQDIDPPRPLDPVISQGETRVVYSRGGISNLTWRTSDASIMSVAPLSEATAEASLGTESVTLNAGTVNPANFALPAPGTTILNTSNCVWDTAPDPDVLTSCTVNAVVPVTFNPDPAGYSISIRPDSGPLIPGNVQVTSPVYTTLNATGSLDARMGGVLPLTGQLTVPVNGDASGTLQLNVNLSLTISAFTEPGTINSHWTLGATGQLANTPPNLLPTNPAPTGDEAVVTNFAILTARRPGNVQLFVTDTLGCTAPLTVQVLGQKLFIDFENPTQGQFIEQGDSIQFRAWTGSRGSVNADNDVTNRSTWVSDNTNVATISPSGRVTAVAPGVANVTATFNTNVTETGTLTSEGHLTIRVDKIHGLTISLDRDTLNRLPADQRADAYRSVAVEVHSPHAVGRSITLEGVTIPITLPTPGVPYASELDQIRGMTRGVPSGGSPNGLINSLALVPGIGVTGDPNFPGVLILAPTGANQTIDISTTALPEEISILPAFTGGLTLPSSETYRMLVTAEYDSGRTRLLNSANVTWVATPVNILDDTGLETGLLKRGELPGGTANVVATFENPDHTVKTSNTIPVRIEEGPVIEFVRRVGSGAILKGTQANLELRVSDIDTIADIQDITVSIVRSSATTYEGINADTAATWFSVYHFPDETVATPPPAPVAPPSGGASGGSGATPPAPSAPGSPPSAPLYRNYTIPVQIPQDANLMDGTYRLVFLISDHAGHSAHFVLPNFRIGPVALGDVNGDGQLNIVDVIMAFQIYNGGLTPTQLQLEAANIDGVGNVTLTDVILLFMQVRNAAT